MAFEKGKSGNPGGRPKKSDEQIKFERRCREWADTCGFDKLRRWAECEDASKSLEALKEIFNRGFGKAVETSIVDASITDERGISPAELAGEIEQLIGARPAEGGRVDSPPQVDGGK